MGVTLISELFQKCLLPKQTLLKGSNSADIRKLYYLSAETQIEVSQTLEEYTDFFSASPHTRKKNVSKAQEKTDFGMEPIDGAERTKFKEILDIRQPKTILQWQKVTQHLSSNIFTFVKDTLSYRF